jgi:hypothetical protein
MQLDHKQPYFFTTFIFFTLQKEHGELSLLQKGFILTTCCLIQLYGVIINYCLIAVGVGDVVECAASFIT